MASAIATLTFSTSQVTDVQISDVVWLSPDFIGGGDGTPVSAVDYDFSVFVLELHSSVSPPPCRSRPRPRYAHAGGARNSVSMGDDLSSTERRER
jgi:hypothetical protein